MTVEDALMKLDKEVLVKLVIRLMEVHQKWNGKQLIKELLDAQNVQRQNANGNYPLGKEHLNGTD